MQESNDSEVIERVIPKPEKIEEKQGKLKSQTDEEKLMHTILEDDKQKISDGKLLAESTTQGLNSFMPDLMFQNMTKDFKLAKKLYGETLVRELTGYSPNYIDKNIQIPEFKRELQKKINEKIEAMKEDGLLNGDGTITDKGLHLSALVLYVEELDHLLPKGLGEKKTKKKTSYGDREDYKIYRKDAYRTIAFKQSIKTAIRRGHTAIMRSDLRANDVASEGKIAIIYGLDASGSMKGEKLKTAKKAGIALAFKAIQERNSVGLVVFGSDIKESVPPTTDFMLLIKRLAEIKASMETNIAKSIQKSIELFPAKDTKHLILLTDALPTKGDIPEQETLKAVSEARSKNITVSLVGINLDDKGLDLAQKIVEIGNGKLYKVTNLDNVDTIILQDYESLR